MARALASVLLVLLATRDAAAGSPDAVPARNQAVLLLRVLLYDRNLPRRASTSEVKVAVVTKNGGDEGTASDGDDVATAVKQLSGRAVVGGRKIVLLHLKPAALAATLEHEQIAAVYFGAGVEPLAPMIAATDRAKTLTFSADPRAIEAGAAVGFVAQGDRIALSMNLQRVRAGGAELDSELLALAELR